jgi:hypothetical protein
LSDYATSTREKLFVNLLLTDAMESGRRVRLRMNVEGPGISFRTVDFVAGAAPIVLNGGVNLRLSNFDLRPYFELNNLIGISPQQYGQQLPEGQYRICFEVYDQFSGQRISNNSCANIYLQLNDPPLLNVPFRGDVVTAQQPQNLIFNWTPRHINAAGVQYEFTLKELWDTGMDPQASFFAAPPLYQTTTFANTLHYGPAQTPLLEGRTYGWQVRAFVSDGFTETSLFRNNGMSEVYHFTYRADCHPPRFVLSEAQNARTVRITWQTGEQLRYRVQYRKKGYGDGDWFGLWSRTNEAIIRNLEPGTIYEFRVGGDCSPLLVSPKGGEDGGEGISFSPIHKFTTPTEDEMAYYNCGIPPEIEIGNQEPLLNLGVNEVFTAGDFPVTVVEVEGNNGRFSGQGFITVPYLANTKIAVEFTNIIVNTDYELIDGIVETNYDPTWGNIGDLDAFVEDIGNLFNAIIELLTNYRGTEEEVSLLQELNQKQDAYISELISSPHITAETKNELITNQEVYNTLSNDLIAESTGEDGYDTGSGIANQVIQKNNELQASIEKAEDEVFEGESFDVISSDPSFKGTLENLKKLVDYFKETKDLCQEEGWASYQDQGIVPWCIWKDAEIPRAWYYSKADLPFVAGLMDGVYQEGEGLVELPKMLYQLGNGINDFIYAYTLAYLQCTPNKVKLNEERMGKLLNKLEAEKEEEGIWSWVRTQWYSVENYVATYKDKKCGDAAKLRSEIDELLAYVQEIENIKNLIEQAQQNLAEYWEEIEQKTNVGRYEKGKALVFAGTFVVPFLGQLTKIKRVKKILEWIKEATPDDLLRLRNRYADDLTSTTDHLIKKADDAFLQAKNQSKVWSGYDCSEIAEDIFEAVGEGKIIRIEAKNGNWLKVRQEGVMEEFQYHEIYLYNAMFMM